MINATVAKRTLTELKCSIAIEIPKTRTRTRNSKAANSVRRDAVLGNTLETSKREIRSKGWGLTYTDDLVRVITRQNITPSPFL